MKKKNLSQFVQVRFWSTKSSDGSVIKWNNTSEKNLLLKDKTQRPKGLFFTTWFSQCDLWQTTFTRRSEHWVVRYFRGVKYGAFPRDQPYQLLSSVTKFIVIATIRSHYIQSIKKNTRKEGEIGNNLQGPPHPTPLPPPILFYYTIKTSILKFLYKKTYLLLLKLIPLCLQVFLWFFKAKTIPNVSNCWYNKSMKVFLWGIQVQKHWVQYSLYLLQ